MTGTTLPSQALFFYAILRHLAAHPDGVRRESVHEAMPDLLDMTEAQRTERLPNRTVLRYRHRSGFGLSMLKTGGYLDNPSPGIWRLTSRGAELLSSNPSGFDEETARQLLRECRKATPEETPEEAQYEELAVQQTPDEIIDDAVLQIQQAVSAELLKRIAGSPPVFFEELVLRLLHALGYGATEDDLERVGGGGDGGIDGIISLDRLGFEKVYVQAKRWQGSVGRPEVQAFYGALMGKRARRGVFITTSTFTREARDFANQVAESIVLIDGSRLSSLMIEYGVGVAHYRIVRLPRVDADFFDSD